MTDNLNGTNHNLINIEKKLDELDKATDFLYDKLTTIENLLSQKLTDVEEAINENTKQSEDSAIDIEDKLDPIYRYGSELDNVADYIFEASDEIIFNNIAISYAKTQEKKYASIVEYYEYLESLTDEIKEHLGIEKIQIE